MERPFFDYTAEEILDEASDAHDDEDSETLKECIRELRRRSSAAAQDALDEIMGWTPIGRPPRPSPSWPVIPSTPPVPPSTGATSGVRPGLTLAGRYVVGEKLGEGGFAEVFAATDRLQPQLRLVIKYPKQIVSAGDMQQEFNLGQQLSHPNICKYHDCQDLAGTGRAFIVLQHGGRSLTSELRSGKRFGVPEMLRVARAIGDALEHAHSKKIFHLDVSPNNILLDESGQIRLTDFGISARAMTVALTSKYTATPGTLLAQPPGAHPVYGAPEQLRRPPDQVGRQTDEWSLALVLCSLLDGRVYNDRTDFEPYSQLSAAQNAAFARALDDNRKSRYGTVREFIEAIG